MTSVQTKKRMIQLACTLLPLVILQALLPNTHAQCSQKTVRASDVQAASNNILTLDDESGTREVKLSTYSINGCDTTTSPNSTGSAQGEFYTRISQTNASSNPDCLVSTAGGVTSITSAQAVVLRMNGWTMRPSFILEDVSAEAGATAEGTFRESVIVFGLHKGVVIPAALQIRTGSFLSMEDFRIPVSTSSAMGLSLSDFSARGVEFAQPALSEACAITEDGAVSQCGTTVSFDAQVDTIVVLLALAKKSTSVDSSSVLMGPLTFGCECRCRVVQLGARVVTEAVPGVVNECVKRESSSPKTECDVLGKKWCSFDSVFNFFVSGDSMVNGNFPCSMVADYGAKVIQDFTPMDSF